jgi:hypothetical protein
MSGNMGAPDSAQPFDYSSGRASQSIAAAFAPAPNLTLIQERNI